MRSSARERRKSEMVRLVVAEVLVPSVRDALTRSHGAAQNVSVTGKKSKNPTAAAAKVAVPYPVGSSTLQLTGVHVTQHGAGKKGGGSHALPCGGVVVLLRAHVEGALDAATRVFTVAALALGGGDEPEQPVAKRRAVDDTRHPVPPAAVASPQPRLPCAAFAKLDLRLQVEKVSFSVDVLPVGQRRGSLKAAPHRDDNNGGSSREGGAGDCSLAVTIVGAMAPLLPP